MNSYTNPSAIKYMSNLDRINKINSKLNNIQNSLSQLPQMSYNSSQIQNYNNINNIEERISALDQKNFESQELIYKEFSNLKKDITNLLHEIEEERQNYSKYFLQRKNFIQNLEKKLLNKITQEQKERKEMEERLLSKIDKNANILKSQLQRENKSKENDNQIFGNFLENEMPKIIKEMKIEAEQRQKDDINLSKMIDDGFTKLYSIINE